MCRVHQSKAVESYHNTVFNAKVHKVTSLLAEMASSALPNAAWDGDLQKVRLLLNQGVDVDATDNGDTALMIASNLGHLKIVQLLLKKNAKLDIKNKRGDTALTCASAEGHLEVVKALLNKNAKVDIKNEMGCTAVQSAEMSNC